MQIHAVVNKKKSLLYYLSNQTRIFNYQLNIAIFYYCTDYKKENATKQPYSLNVRLELKSDITNEIFQKFCWLLTKTNFFLKAFMNLNESPGQ